MARDGTLTPMSLEDDQKPKRGRPKGASSKKSGGEDEPARKPVQLPTPWWEKLSILAKQSRKPIGWYLLEILEVHFKEKGVDVPKAPWDDDAE